eukprot:5435699-Pleurochrysis_carterae.AAC.1
MSEGTRREGDDAANREREVRKRQATGTTDGGRGKSQSSTKPPERGRNLESNDRHRKDGGDTCAWRSSDVTGGSWATRNREGNETSGCGTTHSI